MPAGRPHYNRDIVLLGNGFTIQGGNTGLDALPPPPLEPTDGVKKTTKKCNDNDHHPQDPLLAFSNMCKHKIKLIEYLARSSGPAR